MDSLANLRAFLAVVHSGGFARAAGALGLAPSVVTKRVRQLEMQLGGPLLRRSTRAVWLTDLGERTLDPAREIVARYDELAAGIPRSPAAIEGHIRVKAPTALTLRLFGKLFQAFQDEHPGVTLEVILLDRSVNPIEEGFDLSLGVAWGSYEGVVEAVLSAYPRIACAAPAYRARRGLPTHPRELADHDCLVFTPAGATWTFAGRSAPLVVPVRPRFSTNDADLLLQAAQAGRGIAVFSRLVPTPALRDGSLEPALPDFPLPDLTLKAQMPAARADLARVRALLDHIRAALAGPLPWAG